MGTAAEYAKCRKLVCVLKDACTVIADETGKIYLNLSGNAGMATAGSGDVLAGLLASVCCMYLKQTSESAEISDTDLCERDTVLCDQAALGVFLHGCGGDEAARKKGMHSMTARDICDGAGAILQTTGSKN